MAEDLRRTQEVTIKIDPLGTRHMRNTMNLMTAGLVRAQGVLFHEELRQRRNLRHLQKRKSIYSVLTTNFLPRLPQLLMGRGKKR